MLASRIVPQTIESVVAPALPEPVLQEFRASAIPDDLTLANIEIQSFLIKMQHFMRRGCKIEEK